MKATPIAFALAAAVALSAPAPRDVHAAYTGIQKCQAADGTAVYTDLPCDRFGARPAAVSNELGMRLAAESVQAMPTASVSAAAASAPVAARRSPASGCARTPTQLAMDVQAAAGMGDVNRLAESWHWVGMTHEQAEPLLKRLEQISTSRVHAAQFHGMSMGLQFADASASAPRAQAGTLLVSLQGDGGMRTLQLNVEHYAGCYFARF